MGNEKIQRILERVQKAHKDYHTSGNSILSDGEYDTYVKILKEHGITLSVGVAIEGEVEKVIHDKPVLSQNHFNDINLLSKFISRFKFPMYMQEKLDGISLVLKYVDGRLISAATRGDGVIGQNVLSKMYKLDGVPMTIEYNEPITIRGEVIMYDSIFTEYQKTHDVKNSRNSTAGIMNRISNDGVEFLTFKPFDYDIENIDVEDDKGMKHIDILHELGFNIVNTMVIESVAQANRMIDIYNRHKRISLDYQIDGLVFKTMYPSVEKLLGFTSSFPNFQVAFKFPNKAVVGYLEDVIFQVGTYGRMTPVAVINPPVDISGSTISRATLHNLNMIRERDLHIGQYVNVELANDVIPHIPGVANTVNNDPSHYKEINYPTKCPICHRTLVDNVCVNYMCSARVKGRLTKAVSNEGFKIIGLSEQYISDLVDAGIILSIVDLFTKLVDIYHQPEVTRILGKKNYEKITSQLRNNKMYSLEKIIYALTIEHVGRTAARLLAIAYTDLTDLAENISDKTTCKLLNSIGYIRFSEYYSVHGGKEELLKLSTLITSIPKEKSSNRCLGITTMVTGKADARYSRKDLEAYILKEGGQLTKRIERCNFVISTEGDDSLNPKIIKSKEIGVTVITPKAFVAEFGI